MSSNSINYGMVTQLFTSENTNIYANSIPNASNFNLLNYAIAVKLNKVNYLIVFYKQQ